LERPLGKQRTTGTSQQNREGADDVGRKSHFFWERKSSPLLQEKVHMALYVKTLRRGGLKRKEDKGSGKNTVPK